MSADLIILLGAMIGALAHRVASPNPTWSWATLVEPAVSGAAMVLLLASGVVPDELRAAMLTTPLRTGLFAFVLAFVAGPGVVSMAKALVYRAFPPAGPSPGG